MVSILLYIAFIAGLLVIAIQDFKSRMVLWLLFPVVLLLQAAISIRIVELSVFVDTTLINVSIVFLQLLLLLLYWIVKNFKKENFRIKLFFTQLGLGDMLFFLVTASAFSTVNFVLVFILMLIISTIIFFLLPLRDKRVPLAGIMAVFHVFFILLQLINVISPYNDILILAYEYGKWNNKY